MKIKEITSEELFEKLLKHPPPWRKGLPFSMSQIDRDTLFEAYYEFLRLLLLKYCIRATPVFYFHSRDKKKQNRIELWTNQKDWIEVWKQGGSAIKGINNDPETELRKKTKEIILGDYL